MQQQDPDTTSDLLTSAVGDTVVDETGKPEVAIMDQVQVEDLVDYADSAADNIITQIGKGVKIDPESCFNLAESMRDVNEVFVVSSEFDAQNTTDISED